MDTPQHDSHHDNTLTRAAAWLQARPIELVGLAVLLVSALGAGVVLWWGAASGSSPGEQDPVFASPAAAAGSEVDPDHLSQPGAGSLDDVPSAAPDGDGAAPGETHPAGAAQVAGGPSAHVDVAPPDEPTGPVTVHVTGAVQTQGLVTIPAGARAGAAVEAAGGLTDDAALEGVNLARVVTDGEHLHIPRVGEPVPPPTTAPGPPSDPSASAAPGASDAAHGPLDLNTATAEELQQLPGIGPAKAAAIVTYREEHGPFSVPGDLRAVSGIGEKTFQALADLITVR